MAYFKWTGNPFVDNGIAAMLAYCKKESPEKITKNDLEKMIELSNILYVQEAWTKGLYSSLSGNAHVTAPRARTKKLKLKYLNEELNTYIEEDSHLKDNGDCIACGARDTKIQINRKSMPLTGYKESHFFSFNQDGADYCNFCAFASQFMPLMCFKCGDKVALIQASNRSVLSIISKNLIKNIRQQINTGDFSGLYNDGYKNPKNALFHIATELIIDHMESAEQVENVSIRLYHFTNYNQLPPKPLDIYDLPSPVFRFLRYTKLSNNNKVWNKIVRRGYKYSIVEKSEDEYKNYENTIFNKLLKNESILRWFMDHQNKKVYSNWSFLTIYLKEILFMDKERINAIKDLSDKIAEIITTNDNTKRLSQLQKANKYDNFRSVLFKIISDWTGMKKDDPLITLDSYVDHLFPEGAFSWKETQDLILFRLYEKLHNFLIKKGEILITDEEEEE